jgi:hypothetical protein
VAARHAAIPALGWKSAQLGVEVNVGADGGPGKLVAPEIGPSVEV